MCVQRGNEYSMQQELYVINFKYIQQQDFNFKI